MDEHANTAVQPPIPQSWDDLMAAFEQTISRMVIEASNRTGRYWSSSTPPTPQASRIARGAARKLLAWAIMTQASTELEESFVLLTMNKAMDAVMQDLPR